MRQFIWWRRFHNTQKLPKNLLFKGASELLQRIEFGEYEFNHFGKEAVLEDAIYEYKVAEIKKKSPWLKDETLAEATEYIRKQRNKRKALLMKHHLEAEDRLLNQLVIDLSKEFQLDPDVIREVMETFDGTTRELYFKCMEISIKAEVNITKRPRLFQLQSEPGLKPKEYKYNKLWKSLQK
jgi:negative regulator of replication initiation